jgi:hypothetical protein
MSEQAGFSRQWFTWRRMQTPTERYRAGSRGTPVDDVECAIDHLASSVQGLGSGYMEGKDWDYPDLAARRLEEVARIDATVDACDLPEEEKAVYRRYLAATRGVLEAIGRGR